MYYVYYSYNMLHKLVQSVIVIYVVYYNYSHNQLHTPPDSTSTYMYMLLY